MLLQFIRDNRSELLDRTRARVRSRSSPPATPEEIQSGVPLFLTQFTDLLVATNRDKLGTPALNASASRHGNDLLRRGFTVSQVVHDYGDICQAITELAMEKKTELTTPEFHILNLSLDNAIANAVTEYTRQREEDLAGAENDRLDTFANELRTAISTATIGFQIIRSGSVAASGSTGSLVERTMKSLSELVDRSVAEARQARVAHGRTAVPLAAFIGEVVATASPAAKARSIELTVAPVDKAVAVDVDRKLLGAALSNLLQNAFKFTHPRGHVSLRTRTQADRVLIEVADECGGLAPGKAEELFRPFDRRGTDKSALGVGPATRRRKSGTNGGEIEVQNLPGKGCVFTIELPVAA